MAPKKRPVMLFRSLTLSIFVLCPSIASSQSIEPPFPNDFLQEVNYLSQLRPLINPAQILGGIDPFDLAVFLQTAPSSTISQPNPLAATFPILTTGTINASYVVIPIDYAQARAIIPNQYQILNESIKAVLPTFPVDQYPLVLSTQIDHDIRQGSTHIPDFSSAQFRFPFIDLLNDGYSTFSYIPTLFISNNPVGIGGSQAYGENPITASFDPPQDPYSDVPSDIEGRVFMNVKRVGSAADVDLATIYEIWPGTSGEVGKYPLSFYQNVTNQPTFGSATPSYPLTCDNQIRVFNTAITQGVFRPIGIRANVTLQPANESGVTIFAKGFAVTNVLGARFGVAFIENNYLDCRVLKGYQYKGV